MSFRSIEDKNAGLPKGAVPVPYCEHSVNGRTCGRTDGLYVYRLSDPPITLCREHFWNMIIDLSAEILGPDYKGLHYDRQR